MLFRRSFKIKYSSEGASRIFRRLNEGGQGVLFFFLFYNSKLLKRYKHNIYTSLNISLIGQLL